MTSPHTKKNILLASASPRRRELLEKMGLPHTVHPQDVDETFMPGAPGREARRIAALKVASLLATDTQASESWVLSADTFIALGRQLIGKPKDRNDGAEILHRLSGKKHRVITGLALNIPCRGVYTWAVSTWVYFRHLNTQDVKWYLDTGEWIDAAGAYQIQGAGSCLIKRINGSYPNVMGLPIDSLYGILRRYKFPLEGHNPSAGK